MPGRTFYILTTDGAPRRRVMAIDLDRPARAEWREVVPQGCDVVEQVTLVQAQLIVVTLRDASSRVRRFALDGSPLGAIALPGIGTASGFNARQDDTQVFFDYTSFTHPRSVFRYDVTAARAEPFWSPKAAFQTRRLRNHAGLLPQRRRHQRADVSDQPQGREAQWREPHTPVRLRRVRHQPDAMVQSRAHSVA